MKTYTFYYHDSSNDFRSGKISEFVFTASRLSVAFNAFLNFVQMNSFWYFFSYYKVESDSVSYRALSTRNYLQLAKMRRLKDD